MNYAEIEEKIEELLETMFDPKINIDSEMKSKIKEETLKLFHPFFENIILTFNNNANSIDYAKDVFKHMDSFIFAYEKHIESIIDNNLVRNVTALWIAIFNTYIRDFKQNPADKIFFEYGINKISKLLVKRLRK